MIRFLMEEFYIKKMFTKITCVVACGEWIARSRAARVSNTYI